jgi:hypothetical protein
VRISEKGSNGDKDRDGDRDRIRTPGGRRRSEGTWRPILRQLAIGDTSHQLARLFYSDVNTALQAVEERIIRSTPSPLYVLHRIAMK